MEKALSAAAVTLISGILLSAAPATAGNYDTALNSRAHGSNSFAYQVRANAAKFGSNAFKEHFDGTARKTYRKKNQRHFNHRHGLENACISAHRIHRRLIRQGWSDFHHLRLRRKKIRVKAYRPNGLLYTINVHRCSGHIVSTRLDWSSLWQVSDYFNGWNRSKKYTGNYAH